MFMDNSNEISRLNNHINLLEKHIHILEDKIVKSEARNDNVQLLFESLLHRVQELEEQHAISFNDDHESQSFPIYHSKHKHSSSVDNNTDNSSDKSVRNDTVLSSTESINITSNDMCSIERSEWKYLDKNLVTKASAINSTVDSLISGLSPSKFSECYRQSVRAYILKQIQDVPPGVKVFFQGLYVLDCYLPNDPIRLSLFFWPGHVYKVNWYLSLNEILTASSEDGPDEPSSEKVIDENSDCFMDHTITNLTYSQKSKSLIMQVDEFVDMEIKADNCEEFILLSLVEEFSMLIGKPKLLKDSIILIRAWWFYESKAFLQHKDIKDLLLSDYSLLVMTCAILNERNHEINTPFEVLCYFVGIYSNFDYETHFITINGIKPFCAINSLSTSPSVYHLPTPGLVLTNEVIMKYWNLHKENMNGEELVKEEASTSYIEIERASLNILHPLKNANKTLAYNKRKGNFIFSCFANGASKMHEALLEASKGNLSLIENLLNKIFLLFQNFRVPAAIIEKCSNVPSPIRIRDRPILDELLKQIDFCNLILYRHLTSNGLVFLIKDIITERGPLPIGEIGKTLNMTSLIKDKFGGLKKFLETYQDMFIICSNHAYNPHVFVRSDVDSVQIPTIEKGNSNDIMQTMLQSSKIKIPAGKKKNLKKDDVPTMNQIPSANPLSDQFIQDSRAKANSDNYFYNNDTSVNANNSNNMFAGGNYGSYGFMGSNTTSIDEFSQNTYTQSNSLLRSMEGENSDLMKSSYLFNNLAPRGNDLRNNFLDGNNFRDGRPPGLMPMDDKSRWDIYRSPAGKADTDNLSSLDMNFFNNDFNADLSHLMSGTSLSSSTTATNSSVNVSRNNSNNSINLSRNNSNSIIASRNNSNSIIANGNTNSSINIHRIDSNNTIISSRNNSNSIIASRNNSNNGSNNSIGLNNNDINNNNSLNNGASFINFRY